MDNVLIVVDDLEAAKAFFIELGLKLEGETTVEGPLVASLIGLKDVRATLGTPRKMPIFLSLWRRSCFRNKSGSPTTT